MFESPIIRISSIIYFIVMATLNIAIVMGALGEHSAHLVIICIFGSLVCVFAVITLLLWK